MGCLSSSKFPRETMDFADHFVSLLESKYTKNDTDYCDYWSTDTRSFPTGKLVYNSINFGFW